MLVRVRTQCVKSLPPEVEIEDAKRRVWARIIGSIVVWLEGGMNLGFGLIKVSLAKTPPALIVILALVPYRYGLQYDVLQCYLVGVCLYGWGRVCVWYRSNILGGVWKRCISYARWGGGGNEQREMIDLNHQREAEG